MTSLERVLTTLGYNEPDRVPLMQLFSFYGAKELGISIKEYFSRPEFVVEGQLKMIKKYKNDCIYTFHYASIETEAFGGKTIFIEDGPPNAGAPIINKLEDIEALAVPEIENSEILQKVLKATRLIKDEINDKAPIIGVVMSPFSLPVMQMGFDKYLDLIIGNPAEFRKLMSVNEAFCVNWANAQLDAGATAICYFDPVSSPSIITKEMYKQTGWEVAKRTISQIKGPTATHFASGKTLAVVDELAATKTNIVIASAKEDIGEVKQKADKRMTIMGNLNGIEMCRWTEREAELAVRNIINKAGKGGGLLISDNHGEVPFQVPEKILLAIADAVEKWGTFPLK
ncbi:MAG: uroporphyrinogen decarboxylase family protein [Bacteroidales bacterium]|nr:uroporphyrinogen decarboxylase family protein [Bacteroidales bacterium]